MNGKISFMLLLLTAVALIGVPQALATPTIKNNFTALYGVAGTRIDSCDTCHIPGQTPGFSTLNLYGKDLFNDSAYATNVTQSMINVEPKDSDNDGFSNIDEIHNLTFPGNASDFPPKIVSFTPSSPVNDTAPATETFNITINQIVDNVTWYLDGVVQKTNNSVNASSFTNTTSSIGVHNVTVIAQRTGDGTVMQKWDWNVTAAPTQAAATFNISGFKINNATGSGIQGWNITLMNSTMQTSMLTDMNGSYKFTNLANGTYNITEEIKTGWTNISPISQQVTINGTDIMNVNFTNQPPPVVPVVGTFNISGFKINGTNNNGMGIENWNIVLINSSTGAQIANTTTDSMGSYIFSNLSNGTYNVTEGMKTGWTNVSPMSQMAIINGTDVNNVNFTNTLITLIPVTFNVSGFKINDTNGNGVWDSGEKGIGNWNIMLLNTTTGTQIANTSTNASGFYQFTNLTNGSYNVTEEMKAGFIPTNVTFAVITIENMDVMNVNFTNQQLFNISGFKINDTNGNGVWNSGEIGIENWNIKLLNATTGKQIANTSTNASGFYQFMNLTPGSYNVSEETRPGFIPTNATLRLVTVENMDATNVNFTNQQVFNVSGFKINDANENGVWDSGEMGIENWNIKLLNTTTGKQIANTSTDASGFYQFMNITPGSYNVTEEMKAGFIPTNATSKSIAVENMDVMNVNFTNTVKITSFSLKPDITTILKGMAITITITALNDSTPQTLFNGMANISITANNVSAVNSPVNVNFTSGNATIQVTSSVAQFVTVTATKVTANVTAPNITAPNVTAPNITAANNSVNGSTKVLFADKVFSLSKGWNLISIPNFADPSNVSQALQLVQNNGVVGFDPATDNFSTPTDLEPLFGYWINVTADNQSLGFIASTSFTSVPPSRKLYEGWNLIGVGASRSDPDTLSAGGLFVDLKHGLDFTQWLYTRLVSFEQPTNPVTSVAGIDLSDLTALKQGHGYWLFIKNIPSTNMNNVPWAGKQW